MTADLDLSPEAVERLAWRVHESKAGRDVRSEAAATLRALAAENARLRAEDEASAHDIARLKDSETHWLNEAERLRAERDAAWQAGAEAMREAAARTCILSDQDIAEGDWGPEGLDMAAMLKRWIGRRVLPIPDKEA